MTKIVLKSDASSMFKVLRTPLSVLLHPNILAFHESARAIYVADLYADLTVSRLMAAGVAIEVERHNLRSAVVI